MGQKGVELHFCEPIDYFCGKICAVRHPWTFYRFSFLDVLFGDLLASFLGTKLILTTNVRDANINFSDFDFLLANFNFLEQTTHSRSIF
jgi:hypothetical protein